MARGRYGAGEDEGRGPPPPHPDDAAQAEAEAKARAAKFAEEAAEARRKIITEARIEMQMRRVEAELEEERQLVAAILHGGARLEEIDPRVLRSPKALVALELARRIRDMLLQHQLDASANDALAFLSNLMGNNEANPKDRVTAAQTILTARAKMGSMRHNGTDQLRQALVQAGASRADVRGITDEDLNERMRNILARTLLNGDG